MCTRCSNVDIAELKSQCSGDGFGLVIDEVHFDVTSARDVSGSGSCGRHERIFDCDCFGDSERDVAPDAGVAAADGRDPIPSNGGVIGGVVRAESAAVLAADLEGLLLAAAGCRIFLDADSERVGSAGQHLLR